MKDLSLYPRHSVRNDDARFSEADSCVFSRRIVQCQPETTPATGQICGQIGRMRQRCAIWKQGNTDTFTLEFTHDPDRLRSDTRPS